MLGIGETKGSSKNLAAMDKFTDSVHSSICNCDINFITDFLKKN
jgi:hypothetical protein